MECSGLSPFTLSSYIGYGTPGKYNMTRDPIKKLVVGQDHYNLGLYADGLLLFVFNPRIAFLFHPKKLTDLDFLETSKLTHTHT